MCFIDFNVDYFFSYKYVLRHILINQLGEVSNTYRLPLLHEVKVFFLVRGLEFLSHPRAFNYLYLSYFFLGAIPFLQEFNSTFDFGRSFHDYKITCSFVKNCYSIIFFLTNELLYVTNKNNYSIYDNYFSKGFQSFCLSYFDMNLFLEKKTSIGLYNLEDYLNFRFYIKCLTGESGLMLFNLLKIV
jgi:hypothetical protein